VLRDISVDDPRRRNSLLDKDKKNLDFDVAKKSSSVSLKIMPKN